MKEILNQDILELFTLFDSNNYELYLVGGCVRDYLRKQAIEDYDFTTNATPQQMIQLLSKLDATLIPTGLQHGTLTLVYHNTHYELTTYRSESEYSDFRRPVSVSFVNDLISDLKRRDFTMNAICYNPTYGFVDPLGGQDDLNNHLIRCIGDPNLRFREDALRILRALRFSLKFNYRIETKTYQALIQHSSLLEHISKERIQSEWNQMLMSHHAMLLTKLKEAQVLYHIFPSLNLLETTQENPWHSYDCFTHTDIVLSHTEKESLSYKLAAIFHDIGKKDTKTFDNKGIAHFYEHACLSEQIARESLTFLKYSKKIIERVCLIIRYHDYHLEAKEKQVRKFLGKIHQDTKLADEILRFQISDNAGKNLDLVKTKNQTIEEVRLLIKQLELDNSLIHRKDLAVDGYDLLHLNVEPKRIGKLLDRTYDYVVLQPSKNNKKQLLQVIKQWIKE